MKIAVYSPVRRQGSTTVSMLLALAIAQKTPFHVTLSYTGVETDKFNRALGLKAGYDKTRSVTQLIRLMQAEAIKGDDILDYLYKIEDGLSLLHTASDRTNRHDSDIILNYALDHMPEGIVITDINSEPYEATTLKVLNEADTILIVLSQDVDSIHKYRKWKESEFFPPEHKMVYLVNQYDENVSSLRDTSKLLGVKSRRVCKLSYNPNIMKYSNNGKLPTIMPYIFKNDIRVLELNSELRDLVLVTCMNMGVNVNWR